MVYFVLILAVLSLGSPAAAQQGNNGFLEVRVKDHREAIEDFSRLDVAVEALSISPKTGLYFWRMGWKSLNLSIEKVDLTKYIGQRSATIFIGQMAPSDYEAIHLKLKAAEGVLKKDKGRTSIKNMVGPIKLSFSVKPKETTLIILDLAVMDISDHPPLQYELQLQGYELYNNSKLVEKVPPG